MCIYYLNGLGQLVQFHTTTLLSLRVFHFLFSPVAAFGNILVIYAPWKASLMPDNIKKLFLSLAFSDLAVGLSGQLMYAVVLTMAVNGGHNFELLCPTVLTICYFFLYLVAYASFLNLTVIAVDRLLVITLHLRYLELVTSKRVIIALVLVWITSGVAASLFLAVNSRRAILGLVCEFIGFLLTTVAYVHTDLQSCKTSSESNTQSTSASKCASNTALPRENVRCQCCAFLRVFCRMLSSEFLLCNIVNNRQRSNFFLVSFSRHIAFRSSQLVIKSCSLLLAISRNSSNYEKHNKKNVPHHRNLRWNEDEVLIRICIVVDRKCMFWLILLFVLLTPREKSPKIPNFSIKIKQNPKFNPKF